MTTLAYGRTFGEVFAASAANVTATLSVHPAGADTPPHAHANDYVCLVLAGRFRERTARGEFDWRPGDAVIHRGEERHQDSFGPTGARCLNLHVPAGLEAEPGGRRCDPAARSLAEALAAEVAMGARRKLARGRGPGRGALRPAAGRRGRGARRPRLGLGPDRGDRRRARARLAARGAGRPRRAASDPCGARLPPAHRTQPRRLAAQAAAHRAMPAPAPRGHAAGRPRRRPRLRRPGPHDPRVPLDCRRSAGRLAARPALSAGSRRRRRAGACDGDYDRVIAFDAGRLAARLPGSLWGPSGEMVDAADSKSVACKGVLVRVRPGAPPPFETRSCP